jgi:hypothetical protein
MTRQDSTDITPSPTHSVNYVWLCPRGPRETFPSHATRLTLHNFERIYSNAERYPDAQFNLWLDFEHLTIRDRFFMDSHRYAFGATNVEIRNAVEILWQPVCDPER